MHFIERLKEKPSHVKSRIAFFSAVSFTGIIALVWLSTIPARFHDMETFAPKKVEEQKAAVSNALDEIITGAKEGIDSVVAEDDTPTPPPSFEGNSALRDLSSWSATATSAPPIVETSLAPKVTGTSIPTPPPTPIPTPAPASTRETPPESNSSIGGKETIGGMGESKSSVILIGTSTKKSE